MKKIDYEEKVMRSKELKDGSTLKIIRRSWRPCETLKYRYACYEVGMIMKTGQYHRFSGSPWDYFCNALTSYKKIISNANA